jgi:signal transduction histidine kinase
MRERLRNAAAITIAGACLVLGVFSWLSQEPPFSGVKLVLQDGTLVVGAVDPGAGLTGSVEVGMVVREVDGFPVAEITRPEQLEQYRRGDFTELGVDDPVLGFKQYRLESLPTPPIGYALIVGVALLAGIAVWVARGHAGESLRRLGIPLAVASATPLILVPTWAPVNEPLIVSAVALPMVARLLLADAFVEGIPNAVRRRVAAGIAVLATAAYVVIVVAVFGLARWQIPLPDLVSIVVVALAAAITLVPVAILLRSEGRAETTIGSAWRHRAEDRIPILLAALTPTVIALGYVALGLGVSVPLLWLLVVVIVLQTNARVDTLRIQRDTVVAATEVERARLAADLHDDALQEMTLLVRRLDEVGDARAAELARSIADRLREVCGELRLPILDELGAGPALEWLVERVGETSGRSVVLERVDAARPPADVELAVFRVAQEALANAVTHGAPPITVRYDAGPDRAALSITDHGIGFSADTASAAGRAGHYGLLNMRQRAEQIGARLGFSRPADGGTTIGFVWAPG